MLGDSVSVTYNTVAKTLVKINQDNFGAVYRLDDIATSGFIFEMNIKHTIPARGKPGESHLVRLDASAYDAEGVYTGTTSVWTVIQSKDLVQDKVVAERLTSALADFITIEAQMSKVIGRES